MAPNPRVNKALSFMRDLGISNEEVKPVLIKLLRIYDGNWEHIEDDNYRTLVDAYFDFKDDKGAEGKRETHFICRDGEKKEGRQLLADKEDQALCTKNSSSQMLYADDHEISPKTFQQKIIKPSQTSVEDIKPKTSSQASYAKTKLSEVEKISNLPCLATKDKKSYPEKASSAGHCGSSEKEFVKPRTKKPKLQFTSTNHNDDHEISPKSFQQKIIEPSQTSMEAIKPKTSSQASYAKTKLSEVEKISNLPCLAAKDKKSYPEKASSAGHCGSSEKEFVEPRTKKPKLQFTSTNHNGLSDASNGNVGVKSHSTQRKGMQSKDTGSSCNNNTTAYDGNITIGSSRLGEVKISLNCDSVSGQPNFCIPSLDVVMKFMDKKYTSSNTVDPSFSTAKLLDDFCRSCLKLGYRKGPGPNSKHANSRQSVNQGERNSFHFISDITKGSEKVKISLIDESGNENLPKFNYIPYNIIYQSASVNISLARISDEGCCSDCSGNCISASLPCACAQETGGEFAYTPQGLLKEEFLTACMSMKNEPQDHHFVYCQECPLEKSKNEYMPEQCKGHLVRKFIKECWRKCGCDMNCGNRIVQRGIRCKLQVFLTREGKGWGVRTLEDLPKGSFVCEYVGEILTNMELYDRIVQNSDKDRHTYPVTLDADWGSEGVLKDEEALCLDATYNGNVGRFINHRCYDANLIDIPVEVETPDHHYYHLAFFTTRKVSAYEELTWDYGIDFDDHDHPIKAFRCCCGSAFCSDKKQKGKEKIENQVQITEGMCGLSQLKQSCDR